MVKPGYKQTEIGVIPEDWEVLPFKNVTKRVTVGIACSATHAYCNDGVAMLRNQNIQPNHLDDKEIVHIDEEFANRFAVKSLKEGDLLTARTGYPGTTCVVDSKYAGAQSFTTLISTPDTDRVISYFLSIYMNSQYGMNFFSGAQIGGAQKNVNAHTLATMPVVLPPKIEQEYIVQHLLDIDQLIQLYEKQIVKKKAIKQGTMQELLTGKKRLPGFENEWEKICLGDVCTFYGGGTPDKKKTDWWNGNIPWISSSDLQENDITSIKIDRFITHEALEKSATQLCPLNSVLVVTRVGVGKIAVTPCSICTSQDFISIVSRAHNSYFLAYTLLPIMKRLAEQSQGTSIKGVTSNEIKQIVIRTPRKEEQKAIAETLFYMDEEIRLLEKKMEKCHQIKQGMMQQLLTGKIRLV